MPGDLYIGDRNNARIRKVDGVTGVISTVAGNGVDGCNGDSIPATEVRARSNDQPNLC